ncbi:TonB-dependent receptor plug domain-containing protein [Albibacterium profundi]|uniref:TonB-dependent receptor plug domain-containing protein n=1 Tax=Albibacterium profundi TaxID=3134906 RepID=A0ABV5CGY8_9SPHI
MKKSALLYLFFLLALPVVSFSQTTVEQILNPLERWAERYPQEKVHLHLDRPYYTSGDTIWLKAYVMVGGRHKLSAVSGAVYVDLISDTDSLTAALKLPVMAGLAFGNIDLPADLRPGNYRLRAYTQWMRNGDPAYFYEHPFVIGSISEEKTKSEISFAFDRESSNPRLTATINYLDESSQPLADERIFYQVRTSNEIVLTDNVKTDENGSIQIEVKTSALDDEDVDLNSLYILSEVELEKNQWDRQIFPVKYKGYETDVQFFPESGNLVAGLPVRVAFKAIGTDGLGVDIKGTIKDSKGNAVTEFQSQHLGMGTFNITPLAGESYQATIQLTDGSSFTADLPEVATEGYVLNIFPQGDSDTLVVRILAADQSFGPVNMVAQNNGEVLFAGGFDISKNLNTLRLPVADFPLGITQFTLFDAKGKPVNERLVFIDKFDEFSVETVLDKETYQPRELTKLSLKSLNTGGEPVRGRFSVSVVNEDDTPFDPDMESTIYSELLLKSELSGYIEKPNYYFRNIDTKKRDHLDVLMLTQGYRKFIWEDLFEDEVEPIEFPPEELTTTISGRLQTLLGKPVANGTVILNSFAAQVTLDTITDADGNFSFDNLLLTDSIRFSVQGLSAKGKDNVEILLDGIPGMRITPTRNRGDYMIDPQDSLKIYLERVKEKDDALSSLGLESRVIHLETVTVTKQSSIRGSNNLNPSGRADQTISGNELKACPTLRSCLEGRLRGVRFVSEQTNVGPVSFPINTRGGGRMLVAIDGRPLEAGSESGLMDIAGVFDQNMIDPASILNIQVLRSPSLLAMYGPSGSNGVILINTTGWTPGQRTVYNIKTFAPQGFSNVRKFYSPKYGVSDLLDTKADTRTTIYWNPVVQTETSGDTMLEYYNATEGSYRVVIEGVAIDGGITRKVIRYDVGN